MAKQRATVMIVEDDSAQRQALSRLLIAMGYRVKAFASGVEFLQQGDERDLGCILLDLQLPDINGLELQKQLATRIDHHYPIVFLTAHADIRSSVRAMKNGAVNYLQKPINMIELKDALNEAIASDQLSLAKVRQSHALGKKVNNLTEREFEVFRHVISGRLNKQIADSLDITEKTVKVHRSRVKEKLAVSSVAELVRLADQAGIKPAA
jgi:FixJ family two-component response regulator